MKKLKNWTLRKELLQAAVLGAVFAASAGTARAQIYLGAAANFAVLGLGGTSASHGEIEVYQSDTVINGNVGAGPFADWTHKIDATINGRVDYDLTDSAPIVVGSVHGGLHQTDLSTAVSDARAASFAAAGLAATQTFSTLAGGQTLLGNGGLNVVRVTNAVTIKTSLTIQGSASDYFVIQLAANQAPSAHTLTLSGMTMNLTGGITADRILWSMHGVGGGIVISSGATVYGTFLAPDRGILVDHGNILGAVLGGGGLDAHSNSISVHSASSITAPAVPMPASVAALIFPGGLLRTFLARRRRRTS